MVLAPPKPMMGVRGRWGGTQVEDLSSMKWPWKSHSIIPFIQKEFTRLAGICEEENYALSFEKSVKDCNSFKNLYKCSRID